MGAKTMVHGRRVALCCAAVAGALVFLQGVKTADAQPSSSRPPGLAAANKAMADAKAAFEAFDFKTAIADYNSAAAAFDGLGDHGAADTARRHAANAECNGILQELPKAIAAGRVHSSTTLSEYNPRFESVCKKAGQPMLLAAARQAIARADATSVQATPHPPGAPSNPEPPRQTPPPADPVATGAETIQSKPDNWIKLQSRALERQTNNDFAGAAADWETLARIKPDSARLFWVDACQNRLAAGQIPQALADCEAALAADEAAGFVGGGYTAHEARGMIYLRTSDYAKALADFQAAAASYTRPANLYGLGLAKLKLGDTEGGNADTARATAQDPTVVSEFARYGIEADMRAIAAPQVCRGASPGSAVQDLSLIRSCEVVYCSSDGDPQVRKNIKHIDDMLIELQLSVAQVSASLQKFRRTCRAIGADMTQAGPNMRDFRDSVLDLSLDKGKLDDVYHAMQRDPDQRIISTTIASMARDFKQPACMTQINRLTTEGLNAAQGLLAEANIDCTLQSIKSWR